MFNFYAQFYLTLDLNYISPSNVSFIILFLVSPLGQFSHSKKLPIYSGGFIHYCR